MHAPVLGPSRPGAPPPGVRHNSRAGHVEDAGMSDFHFDDQYSTFDVRGYAAAPEGGGGVVGDRAAHAAARGGTLGDAPAPKRVRKDKQKAKEEAAAAAAALDPDAPWTLTRRQPWADREVAPARPTEEQLAWLKEEGFIKEPEAEEEGAEGAAAAAPTGKTTFHGDAETDAVGRSWMDAPRGVRAMEEPCFLPKRVVHTWPTAHGGKGVASVRFFPGTGHLLLTAGMDGTAKIWATAADSGRRCLRTYAGSAKGLRDAVFDGDGARFAAVSFDKHVKLWDTETGAVLASLGDGKAMHYCAAWHPDAVANPHVLLAGSSDKKILQWDVRTGDVVQEYNYHLGAVNTVTFFDEGRQFASTSDDKTIRVWEFGIPVQTRYIADPAMHAIPAAAASPSTPFVAMQSADNQILTYTTADKFKAVPKKTFKGHSSAGYACRPCFSTDGRYLASGDGSGKLYFWDWKSTRIARSLQAHDGVCIDVAWHPLETSKVASAGWDGCVKYWD